jgi:2'-5' RNA ligase
MRLFVAIDLPETERRRLAKLPETQRWFGLDEAGLNWVPPENLHVTLKFLGSVPDEQVLTICQALAEIRVPGPIHIQIGGASFLPRRGPMRVFVASVLGDLDRLGALQEEIERATAPLGFPRERRAFHPHITLARPRRNSRVPESFRAHVTDRPGHAGTVFPVESFVLMQSDLKPGGAVYSPVARFPFDGT